ncbi:hypothetical protein ON010_g5328 [Phytophthora cinnamomi]|nr:hypothetical protein ON010_g5328 [Phytophthora cinnamomi]
MPEELDYVSPVLTAVFYTLKEKLPSTPILALADFDKPFRMSVDVSDLAVGGYLFQYNDSGAEPIIAHGSRKLSQAELI